MRLGVPAPARTLTATLLATGLLLGTAACSDEEDPGQEPGSAQTSGATEAAEPGPEVTADVATFEAPSGFEVGEETGQGAIIASSPDGDLLSVVEVDFPGEAPDTDAQAEIALDGLGRKFEVQEPVEVDGVEMWHISGKESQGTFADVYGAVVEGTAVRLTLRLGSDEYDAEQRAAANQQVLDSWTWSS